MDKAHGELLRAAGMKGEDTVTAAIHKLAVALRGVKFSVEAKGMGLTINVGF